MSKKIKASLFVSVTMRSVPVVLLALVFGLVLGITLGAHVNAGAPLLAMAGMLAWGIIIYRVGFTAGFGSGYAQKLTSSGFYGPVEIESIGIGGSGRVESEEDDDD